MDTTKNQEFDTDVSGKNSLTIISPCFNEEEVIADFVEKIHDVMQTVDNLEWELLLIDDGSSDNTLSILSELEKLKPYLRVISLSRNFGHQVAPTAGLDYAEKDAVILMDCDFQHPPELLPDLVQRWRNGAQIVSTVRTETDDASLFKRMSSNLFYWMMEYVAKVPIVRNAADFLLMDRLAYEQLTQMRETHRFLRGMVSSLGMNREFVEFTAPDRKAGTSKYTLFKMLRLALHGITAYSGNPLRLATFIGMSIVTCGVIYLFYILWRFFFIGDLVPGWGSLITTVLIMSGLQLIAIGLVSEYIANIFEETKKRPIYFVKKLPRDPGGSLS